MSTKVQDDIGAVHGENKLQHTETADSVMIPMPRDVFEKLYLNPKPPGSGRLYRTFANPTPVALMGFLISAFPTGCILLGWRGSGGNGAAILPVYIFFGGIVQMVAAVGEWVIGNTFSCTIFFTYGTFWLVHGCSMIPWFGVGVNYSPTGDNLEGQATPEFFATTGFFFVFLGLVSLIYLVGALRTNLCLVFGLIILVFDVGFFTGIYFNFALGNLSAAARCQKAAGVLTFMIGFPLAWLFMAEILEAVDFPLVVPVGDLSRRFPGHNQKHRNRAGEA
ncbi:hypothetical protein RBB50_008287 [Rhinocladiella similis]